jgi:hypothetical protein
MNLDEKRRVVFGNHDDQLDGEVITYDEFVALHRPKWPDATEEMLRAAWERWPVERPPVYSDDDDLTPRLTTTPLDRRTMPSTTTPESAYADKYGPLAAARANEPVTQKQMVEYVERQIASAFHPAEQEMRARVRRLGVPAEEFGATLDRLYPDAVAFIMHSLSVEDTEMRGDTVFLALDMGWTPPDV